MYLKIIDYQKDDKEEDNHYLIWKQFIVKKVN